MNNVLVFDFGASSGRAMLFTRNENGVSYKEIRRFQNTPIKRGGSLLWDIEALFREVKAALFDAERYCYEAVGIDTWGVDFALIGESGELVSPPVCYRDSRTEGIEQEVYATVPERELFELTGIQPARINTLFQLLALRKSFDLSGKVMLTMPDLFAWYLTGAMRAEYTEATTTQLIDPQTRGWNYSLIRRFNLPEQLFPPLIKSGEAYGRLKPEFTSRNVPVVAVPSHDTASAIAAFMQSGADLTRTAFISCGTWALLGVVRSEPLISEQVRLAGFTNEGVDGGISLIRNIPGMWLVNELKRDFEAQGRAYSFAELTALAEASDSHGAALDPSDERFSQPEDMAGKITRYLIESGQAVPQTDGELVRVVLESLAAEFARGAEQLEAITGEKLDEIHIMGGGSRNELLLRLTREKSGRRVTAGETEATACGNALTLFKY